MSYIGDMLEQGIITQSDFDTLSPKKAFSGDTIDPKELKKDLDKKRITKATYDSILANPNRLAGKSQQDIARTYMEAQGIPITPNAEWSDAPMGEWMAPGTEFDAPVSASSFLGFGSNPAPQRRNLPSPIAEASFVSGHPIAAPRPVAAANWYDRPTYNRNAPLPIIGNGEGIPDIDGSYQTYMGAQGIVNPAMAQSVPQSIQRASTPYVPISGSPVARSNASVATPAQSAWARHMTRQNNIRVPQRGDADFQTER